MVSFRPLPILLFHLVSLLSLLSPVHPKADFTLYHTADSLFAQLSSIASHNPSFIASSSCPSTSSIPLYHITSSSPLSQLSTPKLRFLLNFGEHGRELITSEVALTFLQLFDSPSQHKPREQQRTRQSDDGNDVFEYDRYAEDESDVSEEYIRFLIRNTATTVIPLLNEWGHRQVEAGDECSRKNRNGVDLNRNWDFLFSSSARRPHEETYQGPAAFSEEESRCVRDVALQVRPHVYVNVHSGIQELYFGWDHRGDVMIPNMREVTRLYEHINSYHCSCKVGAAGKIAGYVVYGGSMDWMYTELNVSYSLTYEVYGKDGGVIAGNCYSAFNPTDRESLQDTRYRFATSFFSMQHALIEEKLGVIFPYRVPHFLHTPLFMQEDKQTRTSVRVYYHPWRLLVRQFPSSTSALSPSSFSLPVFDPQAMLTSPSPSAPSSSLRVLVLADVEYNSHFTSELLFHLTHQLAEQHYGRKLQLLLAPSFFPQSREEDEWCWDGLSAEQQIARRKERYSSEEEVERIARHVRPHVVIELRQSNETKEEKRRRGDEFDIFYHNVSTADSAFVSSILSFLSDIHPPLPFTSPLSVTSHLHLLLVYRGWTAPPYLDPASLRRRASDRLPAASYLTQASGKEVRCDWPALNPPPSELRERVQRAMRGLHGVLESVAEIEGKGVALPEVREEEEEEERSVLVNGEVLVVGEGTGWLPNVWQSGVGWKAWLLLAFVISGVFSIVWFGWRWLQKATKDLKAAEAV